MYQQIVSTCQLFLCEWLGGGNLFVCNGLTVILKGGSHQPTVFIDENLMDANLMI